MPLFLNWTAYQNVFLLNPVLKVSRRVAVLLQPLKVLIGRNSMKRKKRKAYESWPCVFEVSDAAGPRRFPDKPRVCVKPKCSKPGRALERWFSVSEKVEKKACQHSV